MKRTLLLLTLAGAMLLACSGAVLAQQASPSGGKQSAPGQAVRVCPGTASPGTARCHALRRTDVDGSVNAPSTNGGQEATGEATQANDGSTTTAQPNGRRHRHPISVTSPSCPSATGGPSSGYEPSDLRQAYNVPSNYSSTSRPTIAIVNAYNDPCALQDLYQYRKQFNLNTSFPTITKVNQSGTTLETLLWNGTVFNSGATPPRADSNWAQEISLDLDMASAICPSCNIMLVEADTNYISDLGKAVNTAVSKGATVISNSYGASEYSGETTDEASYFKHPGIAITVSSGDNGYGVQFPAASQYVTAVGGTSLKSVSPRTETAWSGAGSGCSAYIKPPFASGSMAANQLAYFQQNTSTYTGCTNRSVADVAADADPNTGVAVYDSYGTTGSHWLVFGGTSVASPIVASVYALTNNLSTTNPYGSPVYSGTGQNLWDITSGSNGSCSVGWECTAGQNYDGPTGLGTPDGIGAF